MKRPALQNKRVGLFFGPEKFSGLRETVLSLAISFRAQQNRVPPLTMVPRMVSISCKTY